MMQTNQKIRKTGFLGRLLRITLLLISAVAASEASAQTMLLPPVKTDTLAAITRDWTEWESASMSGKLRMEGLPVTPSVKIWMVRDSLIRISLRAPFVGEVGRAEVADSMLLVVNKMNHSYVEEPLDKALAYYPGGIADLQELLLGRIVIPGAGLLSPEIADAVEIYAEEDGSATIVAAEDWKIPGFNYGYSVGADGWPAALMVLPESLPQVAVTLLFSFFENGHDITVNYQNGEKTIQATLELSEPEWDGKGFDALKNVEKYQKLPLSDFFKQF